MASTNFINECKKRTNANRLGKIIVDGIETPISESNNLQNYSIYSGCYVDGNIIGSVYAKCLKGQFVALPEHFNLIDKDVEAQIGVKYADNSTEYISVGKYKVERPKDEITANMSQITAYDNLYTNLEDEYICNIDYSTGNKIVSDLYVDVCNQLGLIPVTTIFDNSTIPIIANPFTNGEKNRTVLQTIAKISGSFIDIDNDTNKIDLCWLSTSTEPDYIFEYNDGEKSQYSNVEGGKIVCGPINCLIIKNSQIDDENVTIKDDESIALYGEHKIIISEDYILYNAELRQQAIMAIWNKVHGMKYVDCKLTTPFGKPFLKLGDKIRVYTSDAEYFDTYVLKHNFTYDGTFVSVIESPALTEQEIKTKQDVSLAQKLSNTQIDVNKQKQIITSVVKTQDDLTEKTSEIVQTTDNISTSINDIQTNLTTLGEAIETVKSTMFEQTAEMFEMLFTQTGIEEAVNAVENALNGAEQQLNTITEYIRFKGAEITLGKSDSQTRLIIRNDRISFMTGDNESAYISENTLYITDSTILSKLQIGHWRESEDEYGNLNTEWLGGI